MFTCPRPVEEKIQFKVSCKCCDPHVHVWAIPENVQSYQSFSFSLTSEIDRKPNPLNVTVAQPGKTTLSLWNWNIGQVVYTWMDL